VRQVDGELYCIAEMMGILDIRSARLEATRSCPTTNADSGRLCPTLAENMIENNAADLEQNLCWEREQVQRHIWMRDENGRLGSRQKWFENLHILIDVAMESQKWLAGGCNFGVKTERRHHAVCVLGRCTQLSAHGQWSH
jgi:hypothetical protein